MAPLDTFGSFATSHDTDGMVETAFLPTETPFTSHETLFPPEPSNQHDPQPPRQTPCPNL